MPGKSAVFTGGGPSFLDMTVFASLDRVTGLVAVSLVVTPSHDLLIDFLRGRIVADDPAAPTRSPTASRSCAA